MQYPMGRDDDDDDEQHTGYNHFPLFRCSASLLLLLIFLCSQVLTVSPFLQASDVVYECWPPVLLLSSSGTAAAGAPVSQSAAAGAASTARHPYISPCFLTD